MPTTIDYITEYERRYGTSPELDELRSRNSPSIYEGVEDQKVVAETAKNVFQLSKDYGIPLSETERFYPQMQAAKGESRLAELFRLYVRDPITKKTGLFPHVTEFGDPRHSDEGIIEHLSEWKTEFPAAILHIATEGVSGLSLGATDVAAQEFDRYVLGSEKPVTSMSELVENITGLQTNEEGFTRSAEITGNLMKFVGGLKTAKKLLGPLMNRLPVRQALKYMFSAGLEFASVTTAQEVTDKITKGEDIDWAAIHTSAGWGTLFGGVESLVGKFLQYEDVKQAIKYEPRLKQIPKTLLNKVAEAGRAKAEGMTKGAWTKVYGKDMQTFVDHLQRISETPLLGKAGEVVPTAKPIGAEVVEGELAVVTKKPGVKPAAPAKVVAALPQEGKVAEGKAFGDQETRYAETGELVVRRKGVEGEQSYRKGTFYNIDRGTDTGYEANRPGQQIKKVLKPTNPLELDMSEYPSASEAAIAHFKGDKFLEDIDYFDDATVQNLLTEADLPQDQIDLIKKLPDHKIGSAVKDAYGNFLAIEAGHDALVGKLRSGKIEEVVDLPAPTAEAGAAEALGNPPSQEPRLGEREAGATTIIPDVVTEVTETGRRLGSTLASVSKGTKELLSRNIKRYPDHLKSIGVRGKQVSSDLDQIAQRAQKQINNSELDYREIFKGVSKENREKIAKFLNGRIEKAPKWIQVRAEKLREVLDMMMTSARDVGIERRVGGKKVEIRGSGKAFPQVTNALGDKILKDAGRHGLSSPSVLEVAEEAVQLGLADSVEEYVVQLQRFREDQLRGVSSYLERTRVELPERFIEWDPDRVIESLLQRTWLTIEGTRQWGADKAGKSFPSLMVQIEGIRQESPDEAKLLEQYINAAFGKELLSSEAMRNISGTVRGYQFITKISVSPLTIARNMLDRFAKSAAMAPASVTLKTIVQYPPFINAFLKHSREYEEEIIRRGAVFSNTAIGEGYQPGHLATKLIGKAFASSERGNQVFLALQKKNAIDYNLRLLRTNPKVAAILDKRIGGILSPMEAIGRSPRQALSRLKDIGNDDLIKKLESVDSISPDLLDEVLYRTVKDTAFPVILSTKRAWWDNKPGARMLTQFKVWGTDQVGHIWNDVIVDTVKNRDPSKLVRWLVTMALMGELYNILRDFALGKDESLLKTLADKDRKNVKDVSSAILKDIIDGGGVGILADIMYGLPNLIGGPTAQTLTNISDAVIKTVWSPSKLDDVVAQLAIKETPAFRQAQGILDKIDAQYQKKNITQDYFQVRRQSFDWAYEKKYPTKTDKAKKFFVGAIAGWTKNVPQERTLNYEMAIRQIMVGDTEDASEHMFFLLKSAKGDEELLSVEQGITSSINNASPLGKVAAKDMSEFFSGMSAEQRRTATSIQLIYDRNASEAYGLAVRKYEKWRRDK